MRSQFNVSLNYLIFFFTVLFSIVIQTTLFNNFLFNNFAPDLLALIIIYMGFRRTFIEGILSVSFIAYLVSLHSGTQSMFNIFLYLFTYLVARYIGITFYVDSFKSKILSIAIPAFAMKLFVSFWAYFSESASFFRFFFLGILSSILTALLGLLMFKLYKWLDELSGRQLPAILEEIKKV